MVGPAAMSLAALSPALLPQVWEWQRRRRWPTVVPAVPAVLVASLARAQTAAWEQWRSRHRRPPLWRWSLMTPRQGRQQRDCGAACGPPPCGASSSACCFWMGHGRHHWTPRPCAGSRRFSFSRHRGLRCWRATHTCTASTGSTPTEAAAPKRVVQGRRAFGGITRRQTCRPTSHCLAPWASSARWEACPATGTGSSAAPGRQRGRACWGPQSACRAPQLCGAVRSAYLLPSR
mmetsp:Transcript_51890/g.143683  ORF Transcript_51890/g.143683 Transcript_51890/m.143683 type:complete len:233 (+) Transcript_51890:861-1559(+)